MPRRRVALAVLAALVLASALPAAADARIWWMNAGDNDVESAELDGSGLDQAFITDPGQSPAGMASNGTYVFWGTYGAYIGRASATGDGSDTTFLNLGPAVVWAVAADANHVYYILGGNNTRYIGRITTDGAQGGIISSLGADATRCGIAVDSSHIYWSQGRYVGRADLDGGNADPTWRDAGAGKYLCGLAADANYVYYAISPTSQTDNTSTIGRFSKDDAQTSPNNSFITGARLSDGSVPSELEVDSQYVYWTQMPQVGDADGNGGVGRAPKTGGAGGGFITLKSTYPYGLALDFAGTGGDGDGDGVPDATDNCPAVANSTQANSDTDGAGDACDADDDNDGVTDSADNCRTAKNPGQADLDGDDKGDACDGDDDNDGAGDSRDNCPRVANGDQRDDDGDGRGHACDDNDRPPPPPPLRVVFVDTKNGSFRTGGSSTPVHAAAAGAPVGTVFTYKLMKASSVVVTIQRKSQGRKVNGRCRKKTATNAGKPKCTLWKNVNKHRLFRTGKKGSNQLTYTGRVRGVALTPGRYRAVFRTRVGTRLSKRGLSVKFRIVAG